MTIIDDNNLLGDDQFGYRPGRSCELMLAKAHHTISAALDSSYNSVDSIFLDFTSAFDKVDHNKLILKLFNAGVTSSILHWIQDFLCLRRQRVVYQGFCSNWSMLCSGVPQGSVLGPILFLLFVSDILDCIKSSKLYQFADDHTLIKPISSSDDQHDLQSDLSAIYHWSIENGLPLNPSKCKVMHFSKSSSHCAPNYSYSLGNMLLDAVDHYKILGVYFSKDLTFGYHIDQVCSRASKLVGFASRCTYGMPNKTF